MLSFYSNPPKNVTLSQVQKRQTKEKKKTEQAIRSAEKACDDFQIARSKLEI